jgi:hypothetical protein
MLPRYTLLTISPTTAVSKVEKGIANMESMRNESDHNGDSDNQDNDGTDDAVSSTNRPKRKFRIIDETQLSEEEARKLELRRAYNRDCASRARTRTKTLVQELQDQVRQLKDEKEELRQANTTLQACLAFSERQNRELIAKQSLLDGRNAYPAALGPIDLRQMNTGQSDIGIGSSSNTATSLLMLQIQQQRQQQDMIQHAMIRQQQAATLNATKLFPQSHNAPHQIGSSTTLSNNDINIRHQLMNLNSPSDSKLYDALARLNEGNNTHS